MIELMWWVAKAYAVAYAAMGLFVAMLALRVAFRRRLLLDRLGAEIRAFLDAEPAGDHHQISHERRPLEARRPTVAVSC